MNLFFFLVNKIKFEVVNDNELKNQDKGLVIRPMKIVVLLLLSQM